jgi:hypothetical protein
LVTILTPLVLFGISVDLLLTPTFIRAQYAMPYMPADQYGFDKSERFKWASQVMDYLTNSKKAQYLQRLELDDRSPVFNESEVIVLNEAKVLAQNVFKSWHLSLAATLILGLLAWVGDWLPTFRHGIKQGGWFAMGTSFLLVIVSIILLRGFDPAAHLQQTDTLMRLFPTNLWRASLMFVLFISSVGGFMLTRIPSNSND